jgi:hypothetical protein
LTPEVSVDVKREPQQHTKPPTKKQHLHPYKKIGQKKCNDVEMIDADSLLFMQVWW